MIKAVKTSLILLLLCGGSISQLRGQGTDDASAEAVRRQANTIQLRKTIDEARVAKTRGEIPLAIQKYEAAWMIAQALVNVDPERQQIIAELVPIRMELAKQDQSRGDLGGADTEIRNALRIDPTNDAARKAKVENDRRVAEQVGKRPSEKVLSRTDEFHNERINTSTMVQDARFLIEMGRLDEAEKLLKQAAKNDPESRPTFYYLDLIKEQRYAQEARKREISVKDRMVDVEKSWNEPLGRDLLPTPNPMARTNLVYTGAGRQAIYRKLENINIDDFPLSSDVDLIEVLKELGSEVRKRDPGGRGVNMIISQSLDRPTGAAGPGAIDPLTGLPAQQQASADIDVEKFKIKFDPPLRNVTLKQFLDAVVTVAKPPEGAPSTATLKYSVEDYAIVFSQRAAEAEPYYSRQFRVNPNTFKQGLEGVLFSANPFSQLVTSSGGAGAGGGAAGGGQQGQNGQTGGPGGFFTFGGGGQQGGGGGGGGGGGQNGQSGTGIRNVTTVTNLSSVLVEVRAFFTAAGVDFPTNNIAVGGAVPTGFGAQAGPGAQPQKSLFFNDTTGLLWVRATMRDLDIIENAVQMLNVAPPQVTIEAKFAEFSQSDDKGLGFTWFLGNTLMANGKVGLQGGTAPSLNGAATPSNPGGLFPNPAITRFRSADNTGDENLMNAFSGTSTSIPTVGTLTGILTQPQFRVAIQAIENRQGVDLLSAPTITTISGRQARISVEETATIIVGLAVQGLGGGGGATAAVGATP